MSFPKTRHTLIQRIVTTGEEEDWRQFLSDYWRPVCRFAAIWGKLGVDDAEDVAATTFLAVISGNLLERWAANRTAKLRTLLCTVIRNTLSNRARVSVGRGRLLRDNRDVLRNLRSVQLGDNCENSPEQLDAFYAAWVEELLQDTADALLLEYLKDGQGDCFRVLHGRTCENMTMVQIAKSLGLKVSTAESYYKRARNRLRELLERQISEHVRRYVPPDESEGEVRFEWERLGRFLKDRGGIERALQQSYEQFDSQTVRQREASSLTTVLTRINVPKIIGESEAPA